MSRRAGKRTTFAALATAGALVIPASQAGAGAQVAGGGDGPVATKSGAIINFTTTGKLRVRKRVQPLAVCNVPCNVTGTGVLKGKGFKGRFTDSSTAPFPAGQPFGLFVDLKGALLKAMKAHPGRFRLAEKLTATDPATGATDTVSRRFRFKR